MQAKTIFSSDYGSVQIRRRWICIGHHYGHVFPEPRPVTRQAADILDANPNPCKLRYIRPDRLGYLTKSELEHAQGFPPAYKIVGTLSSWGKQLENAVPCELGRAIGAALAAIPS